MRLAIEAPGFGEAVQDHVNVASLDGVDELPLETFRLVEPHRLRIDVRSAADDKPLADAQVTFVTEGLSTDKEFQWGLDDLMYKRWKTDSRGRLDLKLPFGEATVMVRCPGYARQHFGWCDVSKELTVRMQPAAVVTGNVAWQDGKAVAGCSVYLRSDDGEWFGASADKKGKFSFRELPPGDYTITVGGVPVAPYEDRFALKAGQTKTKEVVLTKKGAK